MLSPKRAMDLALTIPGILMISPLLIGIATWIKIDSKGPVLFRQTRVGQFGIPFQVLKFRTMVPNAETLGLQLTTSEDRRITRSGRFLRKFKLDELPQLFNVIKGDMSLVGPRPEVPKYVSHYPDEIKDLILSVKPGITDRASIEFRNENDLLDASHDPEGTYINKVLPIKLGYYRDYATSNTILSDAAIIIQTIRSIVFKTNHININTHHSS